MRRISIIVGACILVARSLHAQAAADTTASFREGQWGVAFLQGRSLSEGGLLRFSTPNLAWIADGWVSFDQQVLPGGGIFGANTSTQTTNLNASIGPRWYRGINERLVRFAGLGVSGGYFRNKSSATPNRDANWSAGLYAEIGVQYMFTRHFGLGWRGNIAGSRIDDRSTSLSGAGATTTQQSTFYHVALEPVQVMGTIYF